MNEPTVNDPTVNDPTGNDPTGNDPTGNEKTTRCGFVAILGAPNAGKSTLMNRLVGAKLSIVSPKVQTTRSRVTGIIATGPDQLTQIVFIDTPGIFNPRRRLDRAMVGAAWQGAQHADRIVLIVDAKRGLDEDTRAILTRLAGAGRPCIAALNKIDLVPRPSLLGLADAIAKAGKVDAVFMISATTGDGVDDLLTHLAAAMPPGPWHYPEDQMSDMPLRLLAAELTREQVFLQLHDELPYAAAVETVAWEERKDGSARVDQTIYVERESQRAIVLGHGGQRIKRIGATARAEMEKLMERRVHLFLHVKVDPNWAENRDQFRPWGLDYDA